ncbi:MAG: AP protein [Gammaproteobacteria bacterium]|nr:AP protein [Gammaproteobacteria bacterium]
MSTSAGRTLAWRAAAALVLSLIATAAFAAKTRTVVLIVCDGLRWQEVFTGADPLLLGTAAGGAWAPTPLLRERYWRDDPAARRAALLPFLWHTVARRGQIFGNRLRGSDATVTNGRAFSYPGYDEMSVGYADPRIDSNEFGPNPNVSVFEWLNAQPRFHGRVAIYGTWGTFAEIFNEARSHLPMQVGWHPPADRPGMPSLALLRRLYATTTRFDEELPPDAYLQIPLLQYVRGGRVRVLFVGYGETDDWAHQGRYDLVLDAAHRFDGFVAELWHTMQSMPEYRGRTTFLITTDHGRGSGPVQWKDHGVEEPGSENIWLAAIGPDTRPLGERHDTAPITQSQIAATLAAFVGEDYRKAVPRAAPPILDVLR